MSTAISALLILAFAALAFFLLSRQETRRRSIHGPAGQTEYRTPLAIDECLDRLYAPGEDDLFAYTLTRERDGSFLLHLTLHRPTEQPLDTLYSLQMDAGRQTVITLLFIREAFGYREPVFPPELLDEFMGQKLQALRHIYPGNAD